MTGPTGIVEVVVTADSIEWLTGLSRALVEERLVACGQHVSPIRSIYRWEGEVHDDTEARVAYHTRAELVETLMTRIKAAHPYEVPCILVMEIADANPDYVEWVRAGTDAPGGVM